MDVLWGYRRIPRPPGGLAASPGLDLSRRE